MRRSELFIAIVAVLVLGSCEHGNVSSSTPSIYFGSNPVEVALDVSSEFLLNGGDRRYQIVEIADTTIIIGKITYERVLLTGKKIGNTFIKIGDGSGNTSGKISVSVKDLVIRPIRYPIPVRSIDEIGIESKRKNYSIHITDSSIAKIKNHYNDSYYYTIEGYNFGTTEAVIIDSTSMIYTSIPIEVIEWPAAELRFTSNVDSFSVMTGHWNDQFAYVLFTGSDGVTEKNLFFAGSKFDVTNKRKDFYMGSSVWPIIQGEQINGWINYFYSESRFYYFKNATITLSTITANSIEGTFSGTGYSLKTDGTDADTTNKMFINDGKFNITVYPTRQFVKKTFR